MNSTTTAPLAPKKPGLLINRNYALLFMGGTVSVFGDVIFDFTLFVWVALFLGKGQTWAPVAASGVGLAALIPMFLFGPLAAVFVDRWDKRRTMLSMDAIRAILIALLILAANVVPLPFFADGRVPLAGQLIAIYAVVFLNSFFSQFFGPAKMALIGDIVPREQQAQAGGLSQVTQSVAMLLAPPIAPILALTFGVEWALLIDSLTFVFSYIMILAIQPPKATRSIAVGEKGNVTKEFFQGLAFALHNRFVATLIIAAAIIMFGASAMNTLDIFFVLQNLHASPQLYGFLTTAMGVGLIIGSVLSSAFSQRVGLVRTLNLSLLVVGIALFIYSRLTHIGPALVVIFVAGVFQATLNSVAGPLLLRVTPPAMVGRVAGIMNPIIAMMQMLGTILSGYLASNVLANFHATFLGMQFGQIDTIFTGGAVIAILGTFYSLARIGFRDPAPYDQSSPTPTSPSIPTEMVPAVMAIGE